MSNSETWFCDECGSIFPENQGEMAAGIGCCLICMIKLNLCTTRIQPNPHLN